MMRLLLLLLAVGLGFVSPPAKAQSYNQRAAISFTGTGDQTIIAGIASKSIAVYGIDFVLLAAQAVTVKCGSTAVTGAMTLVAWSKPLVQAPAYFTCGAGEALILGMGGSTTVGGIVWYRQQ